MKGKLFETEKVTPFNQGLTLDLGSRAVLKNHSMEPSNSYLVYMTAGDMEEARSIGRVLVESRLAACVNILENMTSVYCWDGSLQEDNEVVVLAKTTAGRFAELKAKVAEIHSYDCPCILGFRVSEGHPPFMDWIRESVARKTVC